MAQGPERPNTNHAAAALEHALRVLKAEVARIRADGGAHPDFLAELDRFVAEVWRGALKAGMPLLGAAIEEQVAETISTTKGKVANEDPGIRH